MERFRSRWAPLALLIGSASLLTAAGYGTWYYQHRYKPKRVFADAKTLIANNLNFLAVDEIEPYYRDIPKNVETCDLLIKTYHRTGMIARMIWWTEACLVSNVQIPAVFLGLAAFQETQGNLQDAMSVLMPMIEQFPDSPEIPYEAFRIIEKMQGLNEEAVAYLVHAQARSGASVMLARDPLRELIKAGKWKLAHQLVEGISNHPTSMQDDVMRMMISQVYRHEGEAALAHRFEIATSVKDRNKGK